MNFKDELLNMDKKLVDMQYIDDTYIDSVDNLFLTIETEGVTYSPCCYLDEDETWVKVLVLSSENSSHCSAIKKDSIVSFGFLNTGSETFEVENSIKDAEGIYQ
jgi:hypothetical protein